jgi:hypothetical protein
MLNDIIKPIDSKVEELTTSFLSTRYWLIKSVVLVTITAFMFSSFPSYEMLSDPHVKNDLWGRTLTKFDNPLKNMGVYGTSQVANRTFRITVPAICHILGLRQFGSMALMFCIGLCVFAVTGKIVEGMTNCRNTAFLAMFFLSGTFPGVVSFVDISALFDGMGVLCLLLALYLTNPLAISLCVFLAAWTDERALIASSFVLVYHQLPYLKKEVYSIKKFLSKTSISIVLIWAIYFLIRYYLIFAKGYSVTRSDYGFVNTAKNISTIPLAFWTGLESGWLVVLFSIIILLKLRQKLYLAVFLALISIHLSGCTIVHDLTRSVGFIVPVYFVSLKILCYYEQKLFIRNLVLISALIAYLSPNWIVGGPDVMWQYPLPLQALRWFFIKT